MDSVRLGVGLVVLALLVAVPNALATTAADFYAGIPVRAIVNEHGYKLVDVRTNQTILYFNHTAINENLDGKPVVTKDEAVKIAKEICGEAYTLVRVTENPYDYDLQFERQIDGIAVFGEDCYVVVNRMTGKVAAFRKMPVEEVKVEPVVKVKKEEALKIAKARTAKLYIVPGIGAVWFTDSEAVDAATGKILSDEMKRIMEEKYRTTVDFGKLEREVWVKELRSKASSKGVNNNQGAVFRAGDWWLEDNTEAAKDSMEKGWDPYVDDYGEIGDSDTVNEILSNKEAVFYSGHGNKAGGGCQKGECIVLKGTGKDPKVWYCKEDVGNNLQTRLFVIQACYAADDNPDSLANVLVEKGVQCVIGATGSIHDYDAFGLPTCRTWADVFWDHVTGNSDVNYQKKTAHEARIEANNAAWFCDLDREVGNCNIYI